MVVNGLVSLRTYKRMDYFYLGFDDANKKCANATFCYNTANRWLALRLDVSCLIFTTSIICVCLA